MALRKKENMISNRFGIEVINGSQLVFRIWNFNSLRKLSQIKDPDGKNHPELYELTVWQIFRNVQYRWDLNN